jgi:hypothetical protein
MFALLSNEIVESVERRKKQTEIEIEIDMSNDRRMMFTLVIRVSSFEPGNLSILKEITRKIRNTIKKKRTNACQDLGFS